MKVGWTRRVGPLTLDLRSSEWEAMGKLFRTVSLIASCRNSGVSLSVHTADLPTFGKVSKGSAQGSAQ